VAAQVSDMDSLARIQRGDREGLRVLFRRHLPIVYGAAFVVTRSAPDAEEAAQDAFFLLWQKRSELKIVGDSMLPWLIVTARFEASNRRRAANRRETVPLIEDHDIRVSDSPETIVLAAELQRRLTVAIEDLPPLDRDLIISCLVEGKSYADAAESAGVTHGAVRNRLSRARQQLRTQMTAERNEA
jgi:RNA polymerase sigma factor (sigma-70 family)